MTETVKEEDKVPGKELATAQNTSVAVSQYDDFLTGTDGHDDFSASDFTVPYLGILQALSKPLQRGHEKYVDGAQQGFIINSATREVYDVTNEGVLVIPCFFHHRYQAWKPNNGGPAYDYGSDSTVYDSLVPNEKGKRLDAEGNELVDSLEYFCLMLDRETGVYSAVVIPFSGSFAKKARRWNNLIRAQVELKNGRPVKPPLYFYVYEAKTVPESNEKGSWYSWDVSLHSKVPELPNGAEIFRAAQELRASVVSGALRAASEAPEDDNDEADGKEKPF